MIEPEINIENIRQQSKVARAGLTQQKKEATNELLRDVLKAISNHANGGSMQRVSVGLHDVHHKEIYPLADREKVLKILNCREFEASIERAHPAFPDCDCGGKPCMDWIKVKNTWSCRD